MKHETEPETRAGNCCGCHTWPVLLFRVPGPFRYRCAACFEKETGAPHHLAPRPVTIADHMGAQ